MLKLDDNFLNEIGLANLSEFEKGPFLEHIYQELEIRVGTKLSEGMTDQQMAEFEAIADGDQVKTTQWLTIYFPDYEHEEGYRKLAEKLNVEVGDAKLKAEYAATKWFEKYKPDYQSVVESELNKLKEEIIKSRDAILGQA